MEATTSYTYVYSSSRWSGYVMLLFALGFFTVIASSFVNQTAQLEAVLFLLAVAGAFVWLGLKTIFRKQPELQFGSAGIWTPKLGDVKWQQVILQFGHVTSGKAGTIYTLRVIDRTTRKLLDLIALGMTEAETDRIKAALKSCKRAQFN